MGTHYLLRARAGLCAIALATAAAGCAAPEDEDGGEAAASSAAPIQDGVFTFTRPEIGMMVTNDLVFCTATLIAPNVVLTAAHCVGYGTNDGAGTKLGWFRVEKSADEHVDFDFDAYLSYGKSWGRDDVALLRLKDDVPRDVAVPATLATETPTDASNELVTVFGYGCSNRPGLFGGGGHDDHSQHKQMRQFEMGPVRIGCPGDSGGPTVRGLYGDVFRVSSRIFTVSIFGFGRGDAFGDVVYHREDIVGQIAAWRR